MHSKYNVMFQVVHFRISLVLLDRTCLGEESMEEVSDIDNTMNTSI